MAESNASTIDNREAEKSQSLYSIKMMENAIIQMLHICGGCLSAISLDVFGMKLAFSKGKELHPEHVMNTILPRMKNRNVLYQSSNERGEICYSVNPYCKQDQRIQRAFWMFVIRFMHEADMQSVCAGPEPAQISFSRRGRTYHIIAVKREGENEFQAAINYENKIKGYKKSGAIFPEERYIFLFDREDFMENASFRMQGETVYGVVTQREDSDIPSLRFVSR